jgi:hypothetical protein
MEKKPISHFMGGLIIASILILYTIILNFSGQETNKVLTNLSYILMVAGVIFFINRFGKSVEHTASFGQLFTFGFKMSALIAIIVIFFQVIFFLVFPEYKDKIFDVARDEMIKQGKMSEDQIETGLSMMKKFFWIGLIGGSLFMFMIVGAIGSLIGAAITKRNPQSHFPPSLQ